MEIRDLYLPLSRFLLVLCGASWATYGFTRDGVFADLIVVTLGLAAIFDIIGTNHLIQKHIELFILKVKELSERRREQQR